MENAVNQNADSATIRRHCDYNRRQGSVWGELSHYSLEDLNLGNTSQSPTRRVALAANEENHSFIH
jgi:hypothetical protein